VKRHFKKIAFRCAFTTGMLAFAISSSIIFSASAVEVKGTLKTLPQELENVGIQEHLGQKVDLDQFEFTDSADGKKHKLNEYFQDGKPTLVNLVYFECPMLCTLVLNGVLEGVKQLDWQVGKQFNVVTISINPKDTVEMANKKRDTYLKSYTETPSQPHTLAEAQSGWHFFTSEEAQVKKFADQLGFEYKYDAQQQQYAHPAVTFVLTPDGHISRYLYGIEYKPKDLRLSLLEASKGKVGNVFDRILLFCYHYEPSARGYTLKAMRVMQLGGLGMVALLGGYLTVFWTRQRKGKTT